MITTVLYRVVRIIKLLQTTCLISNSISLGRNSSSFMKSNGGQKFCSTLQVSSNTSAEYISLESPNNHVMQKRQIKKYAIQTNCSNRSRAGVQGHLSQMILAITNHHSNKGQSPRSLSTNSQDSANGATGSIIWYHVITERDGGVKCQR